MSDKKYSGMTVNERLFEAGLLAEFDKMIREKNPRRMREILLSVELDEAQAAKIIENCQKKGIKD